MLKVASAALEHNFACTDL